mgnify:CR=1 FL=1
MSEIVKNYRKVVKVTPVMTADDNADNDGAFDWTSFTIGPELGLARTLQSVTIMDGYDDATAIELVFCRGGDNIGTAPTSAQGLIGGSGAGSAAVDITVAEAQAIEICGHVNMTYTEGDLILARMATQSNIGLVLSPQSNSSVMYIGGIWRGDPPDMTSLGTGLMDIYLGFEG